MRARIAAQDCNDFDNIYKHVYYIHIRARMHIYQVDWFRAYCLTYIISGIMVTTAVSIHT